MKRKVIFALATLALSFNALATSIWKIEKDNNQIYIGGTIHVLSKSDYPLPEQFNIVFEKSDELLFETDLEKVKTQEFQIKAMQKMSYQNGRTIASDLSEETLNQLKNYMKTRGLQFEQFAPLKASLLGVTIAAVEIQLAGIVSSGVDEHFLNKANADHKEVSYLESIDDQINALASMGQGKEDAFIKYSLDMADQTGQMVKDLIAGWRDGNIRRIDSKYVTPLAADYPQVYDALLVNRNNQWLPKIERLFDDPDTEFVLVGLLHLAGEHSVLKQLSDHGYKVTQVR